MIQENSQQMMKCIASFPDVAYTNAKKKTSQTNLNKNNIPKPLINASMKKIIFGISVLALITISACNDADESSKEYNITKMNADTTKNVRTEDKQIAEVTPVFSNVDPKLAASLKTVVDHYLHIKNALVNNDGSDAANGGKAMDDAMGKIDKPLFTAEQKKVYDGIEDDLKEHAEHIGKNAGDIEHQREHFSMMSEDLYDLVKAFGAGQTLYHDHCPMANDSKGGMWLSEIIEAKNPYFGGKMNECVKVAEVIK
jgi:hypothetical protein